MHTTIHAAFDEAAARFGPRTAIDATHSTITYAELRDSANRLAHTLLEAGAQKGDLVCVLADNTVTVVTAILGSLKAGCAFVPLDVRTPQARLHSILEQTRCRWYVAEAPVVPAIGAAVERLAIPDAAVVDSGGGAAPASGLRPLPLRREASTSDPDVRWAPDDLAYIYFTSGSTGRPKGIAGRAKAIAHFIDWEIRTFGLKEGVRVSQFTTPAFDAVLRDYFVPLCAGGVICAPTVDIMADADRLAQWIEGAAIEVIHCVPSLFRVIARRDLRPEDFPALRYVLMAGEPLLPDDVSRWTRVFGERIRLVNMYGPSETTMIKLFHVVSAADAQRPSIPIGKPIDGAAALVLDEKRRVCAVGAIGEIYIRTPYRSLGYFDNPELTHAVFIQNPFSSEPDDIVYATGDLGRILPDGNFEFLGRRDHQVKIRGIRVELTEIENALRSHPAIRDVAVTAREDGSGFTYLCAYVVQSHPAPADELRGFLTSVLPDYMVPTAFVVLAALPRSLNGKVDRRALPPPAGAAASAGYVAPRSPVERKIAEIWREVFGLAQIGIHDDFLALGGHSLLAMQILSRIRAAFDVEIPLRSLFGARTIGDVSALVSEALVTGSDRTELAALVQEIESMPDDAVDDELARAMNSASGAS